MRRPRRIQIRRIQEVLGDPTISSRHIQGTRHRNIWKVRRQRTDTWMYVDSLNRRKSEHFDEVVALYQGRSIGRFVGRIAGVVESADDALEVLKENVTAVKDFIEGNESISDLQALLKREKGWKKRSGVIKAIEGRIKAIEELAG